ncbi:GNAT family N-acetyltransferase [Paenibacillus sp. 1P07SE]|uniref:GNAT family N-acetyltransferase n=1 Tax=Paenibacillus sp. 1P07SE TaxID=3132209 RepID=UPI0039A5CF25
MKQAITVQRFGVRLRPVTEADAAFIYRIRRMPELAQYIGDIGDDYAAHQAWLAEYLQREDDYYFCIERMDGEPLGTIAVYDIAGSVGHWGRWIILPAAPAAPASVWLAFHVAFEQLGLDSIFSNTAQENGKVISFHERCGLERIRIDAGALTIRGKAHDMVIHRARREAWPQIRQRLEKAARMAQRLLEES